MMTDDKKNDQIAIFPYQSRIGGKLLHEFWNKWYGGSIIITNKVVISKH